MSTEITIQQDQIDINVTNEIIVIESPTGGYPLPNNVYSVFGRVGNVVAQDGDYNLTQLGDVTISNPLTGQALVYNGTSWVNNTETYVGTVTSVNMSVPNGFTIGGNPITTAGTLALGFASGYSIPTTASQSNWDTAYSRSLTSAAVTGTTTKTLTLNEQGGGTITATWNDYDTAPVTSVFGRTGAITAQSGDYTTLLVPENTNLYFTDQRARYAISGDSASGVVYQNTTGIIALDDIPNTSLLHDSVTVNGSTVALGGSTSFTTSAVAEGTNLYFTTARAQAAITGTAPISVASGVVSISQSGPSTDGYLSSADWNTFNAKQSALTLGNLTSSDITVTGGSGAVVGSGTTMTLATVNSNVGTFGSSTAIPVITVNGKGLVTAVTTDAVFIPSGALSFIGDVTGTGNTGSDTTLTLATVNSNVGSYGDSTHVPTFTVNAKGLITAASQTAIPTASTSTTGLLTSTDWNTFNGKQNQLNGTGFVVVSGTTVSYDNSTYLTTISGIAAGGELSGTYPNPSLVNSAVTGKVLTGLNVTGGTVVATDSILDAFGKVQNQINGLIGGSQYQGTWNASTNTPALASGVGTKGYYYIVSVAGTTNLDGITDWNLGDWAIFDGTAWQQVDNTDAVVSVNGFTGAVNLTTSNISEGTNLYYTDARARNSVSGGTGISYDNSTGVITNSAPDQTVSLTASTGISTSGTYPNFTITNTAPDQTVSLTASTGISTSGTYPNFTITNTAPDQVVSLTGAGTTSITGTYPNFTVTSNDQYVGTVTSVAVTESGDALTITGSPITSNGTINIGFAGSATEYVAGDGSLVTFPTVVAQAENLVTEVYNNSGATLTKGTIVYINGGQGNLPTVTKAIASADSTSAQTYGVVQADITNMNNGYVIAFGSLTDLDTQAYSAGTQLYLSGTTAGEWTSTKPYAPIHLVYVAVVTRSHPTQGVVEVRIQNGYEMDELHNVSAQNPNNGDILQYVSSTSLWTSVAGTTSNISEGTNLYYTDARARGAISLTTTGNNGASTYNSTTGVLNVPTYTLAGLGGINLTSLSATSPLLYDNTTGVFSIQQSSGSQAGYLSAADWTTFNNKQAALGYTPVPETRTLTINGVGYDLSADRSWTITPNVNATNTQDYTATAGQTTFTVTGGYTVGQLAVYYNGSKLAAAEYSAIDGTTFTLATACQANDIVQAVVSVTGGGIGGSGTTNYLSKWTASGVLGNSLVYDDATRVYIGTTTSAIGGILALNGDLKFGGTAGGNYSITNYQGGFLAFGTDNTERMRITSSGNVGIATSSPVSSTGNTRALQIGGSTIMQSVVNNQSLYGDNAYYDGSGWKYATSNNAAAMRIGALAVGDFTFHSAAYATAGSSIPNWDSSDIKMTIKASGNVGIGTSSPSANLSVKGSGDGVIYLVGANNTYKAEMQVEGAGQFTGSLVAVPSASSTYGGIPTSCIGITTSSTPFSICYNKYRKNEDYKWGQVFIGKTADAMNTPGIVLNPSGTAVYSFAINNNEAFILNNANSGTNYKMDFRTNSVSRGNINVTDTATTYNTGSDYRLKKDFKDYNGIDLISKIKTYDFAWNIDDSRMYGVIAHELSEVLPYAVQGEKDAESMQSVDYSKLTPILVKAIQEQQAMIESQQQQINQLINK